MDTKALTIDRGEKRLDVGQFIAEDMREKDESGNLKPEYVTIRKLPFAVKKKIEFISANNMSSNAAKSLMKYLKKKGVGVGDVDKLSDTERAEAMLEMDMNTDDIRKLTELTVDLSKAIIDNGVDPHKHTFYGPDKNPIELNFDFFDRLGSEALINYVVSAIREYSQGFVLGE